MLVASVSVIAIHAVGSDNIELPETDTTATEAAKATEAEPEITEAVSSEPETSEPVVTEPETMEAEVTEPEPEIPEEIRGILGTFYCIGNFRQQCFIDNPEYISAITFNADGTLAFRIFYGGGVTTVDGTYEVRDNMIRIKCDLTGSPVDGVTTSGRKYMNDEFVLEIVDNDKIVMSDAGEFGCYVVYDGDAFVREQWWLNTVTE